MSKNARYSRDFHKKDENMLKKGTKRSINLMKSVKNTQNCYESSFINKFYPKKCDETFSYYRLQYKQSVNAPENAMTVV